MANKNTTYISDEKKQKYYLEYWRKICKEANAGKETPEKKDPEDEFMDILISEMEDTENRKTIYKQNCNKEEITVIIFAFFSAVFSGLLSIWDSLYATVVRFALDLSNGCIPNARHTLSEISLSSSSVFLLALNLRPSIP